MPRPCGGREHGRQVRAIEKVEQAAQMQLDTVQVGKKVSQDQRSLLRLHHRPEIQRDIPDLEMPGAGLKSSIGEGSSQDQRCDAGIRERLSELAQSQALHLRHHLAHAASGSVAARDRRARRRAPRVRRSVPGQGAYNTPSRVRRGYIRPANGISPASMRRCARRFGMPTRSNRSGSRGWICPNRRRSPPRVSMVPGPSDSIPSICGTS